MKKSLFTLAVAALGFAACTNTEDIENGELQSGKQIGFESHVNKNSRALVNDNFSKFKVFGTYTTQENTVNPVQVFNGTVVSNGTDGWTYPAGDARYWIKGADYTFYAYSKENEAVINDENSRLDGAELKLMDYTVNQENQKDLVFASATATGKETENAKVAFDFKHILSKIHFTFESDFPAGYSVIVRGVKIGNMRDKGTFTASTGNWESQMRSAGMLTIDVPFAEADAEKKLGLAEGETKQNTDKEKWTVTTSDIYVLPFAYRDPNVRLYFTLEITNANNEVVSTKENFGAFKPTWTKGTAYNYKVTLTGAEAGLEKIEFTTDPGMNLDGWTTGTDNVEFNFGAEVKEN